MGTPRRRLLAPLLLLAVAAAGCGGGRKAVDQRAAQAEARQVVRTADLTVRVGDAAGAAEQAARVAREANGFVFAQRSDLEGRKESRLTIKVPPERFEPVLDALLGLGQGVRRDVDAHDVTDQVVDLDGRLRTSQASAERLRALVGEARSTGDIVAIETELAKREAEIESVQGRLRLLHSQVDLATINARLTERADLEISGDVPSFRTALRAGSAAMVTVLRAGVAAGGFLLPFSPLGVAGWLLVRRARRDLRVPAGEEG